LNQEQYILKLEDKLEKKTAALTHELKIKAELHTKIKNMERCFTVNPSDKWYLIYLMQELATIERQYEDQKTIISQYQEHFNKYGKFYQEILEKQRILDRLIAEQGGHHEDPLREREGTHDLHPSH
jgi:hypothetical protein